VLDIVRAVHFGRGGHRGAQSRKRVVRDPHCFPARFGHCHERKSSRRLVVQQRDQQLFAVPVRHPLNVSGHVFPHF
jgi:hypothetical protein